MIQYFINRAGKALPAGQKKELEKAKRALQAKLKLATKASGRRRAAR
jgi:Protein of unknown function (DUF3175)